jgi:hypothetical protein
MTQDEIIEMARQVGAKTPRLIWPPTFTKSIDFTPEALEIFAKLVAAKAMTQRTWVGLTTEETLDMFDLNNVYGSKWIEFARTVEAKLKEKNT